MHKGSRPALAVIGVLGFSRKAILVGLAYSMAAIDAVTLLALRMIYAAPFFAVMAWWVTRREGAALVLSGVTLVTLQPKRHRPA
jgi:hypothetical protein